MTVTARNVQVKIAGASKAAAHSDSAGGTEVGAMPPVLP